ncbi:MULTISPECIES: TonB-dependent receptor plug domain-containing protein [Pseudomonas syringae group]|nr:MULTISPECIES: TonB-dependent receptor [Pseudomonas syringae group]KPW94769.1 putative TonB-dependent siderophore receptor [Pseudomonas syringae pv. castaneae]KWS96859.1 ligand-gated channel [Pseudomonas syringae pv. castaneae]
MALPAHAPRHALRKPLIKSIALVGLGLMNPAQADDETLDREARLDKVTVISTGVRGTQRTVTESPAPIDIVTSDQLLKTGRADLTEAIAKLLPSFNYGTNVAGYNSTIRPLSNRSLAPAYTLVLVNGKRRHNSALPANGSTDSSGANSVDIDMIPISAVERIEVLKDSAAAQYGSDAIAGVINVILKSSAEGGHLGVTYGKLYSGEGEVSKFEGDTGFELGDGGFLHLSADARKRGDASWNERATNNAYFPGDPREATWDRVGVKNGDPQIKAFNLAYNAELPLDDQTTVYSHGTYGQRGAIINNYFRYPNSNANIPELFTDGYYPLNNLDDTDYQYLIGAKGEALGWNWDLSTTYGRNNNHQYSDLTINPSLGPASPTSFDDLATYRFEQWVNNVDITRALDGLFGVPLQVSAGLEHRWERFRTFSGDAQAYQVGGYRFPATLPNGQANPLAGQLASIAAQAAAVISPQDATSLQRNNYAAYVDFGITPIEPLFVDLALRAEHFDDDSGNTVSAKLNSRYEFTDTFAVRGTVGTGFRAPSLTQVGYSISDNRVGAAPDGTIVPAVTRIAPVNSALAQALGATTLDPEKSRNLGFGVTWQPAPRTSLTADAYWIEIDDRIARTESLYGPALAPILAAQGVDTSTWTSYYANAFDTRTRGLDIVLDHSSQYGAWGNVRWSAGFNYNKTIITDVKDAPAALQGLGSNPGGSLTWVGRAREGDLTDAQPKTKWVLGGKWTLGDLGVNLQTTRYGKVKTLQQLESGDRSFGAKWITDLDVSYTLYDNITLSVGGTNIFDVRPDKNAIPSAVGLNLYGNSPFYPGGGFWYSKIAYDF